MNVGPSPFISFSRKNLSLAIGWSWSLSCLLMRYGRWKYEPDHNQRHCPLSSARPLTKDEEEKKQLHQRDRKIMLDECNGGKKTWKTRSPPQASSCFVRKAILGFIEESNYCSQLRIREDCLLASRYLFLSLIFSAQKEDLLRAGTGLKFVSFKLPWLVDGKLGPCLVSLCKISAELCKPLLNHQVITRKELFDLLTNPSNIAKL